VDDRQDLAIDSRTKPRKGRTPIQDQGEDSSNVVRVLTLTMCNAIFAVRQDTSRDTVHNTVSINQELVAPGLPKRMTTSNKRSPSKSHEPSQRIRNNVPTPYLAKWHMKMTP